MPDDVDLIGDNDPLFEDALACALEAGEISTSLLQRKLGVGYARAAHLVDILQERGVIAPPDGAKPQKVISPTPLPERSALPPSASAGDDLEPIELSEFDHKFAEQVDELPPKVRIVIERISFKIKQEGLSIDEACLLCNIDPEWLVSIIEKFPIIARILEKKQLEFRVGLMQPLLKKAKNDDKMAQYLLELRTPKQRRNAAGGPDDTGTDLLAMAISHIQEHGDSTPLVRRESGKGIVLARGPSATKLLDRIKAILPA